METCCLTPNKELSVFLPEGDITSVIGNIVFFFIIICIH